MSVDRRRARLRSVPQHSRPAITVWRAGVYRMASVNFVGWVEPSETHRLRCTKVMGFAVLDPSYIRTASKQRRKLGHLDRAEKHHAVDETQREGAGLLAFEFGRGAERIDAGGDADV